MSIAAIAKVMIIEHSIVADPDVVDGMCTVVCTITSVVALFDVTVFVGIFVDMVVTISSPDFVVCAVI